MTRTTSVSVSCMASVLPNQPRPNHPDGDPPLITTTRRRHAARPLTRGNFPSLARHHSPRPHRPDPREARHARLRSERRGVTAPAPAQLAGPPTVRAATDGPHLRASRPDEARHRLLAVMSGDDAISASSRSTGSTGPIDLRGHRRIARLVTGAPLDQITHDAASLSASPPATPGCAPRRRRRRAGRDERRRPLQGARPISVA